ncbi:MAG: protein kinase [Actinomycetota bacterium]|nr:protein kinase [Actinomycetota bacterium]
MPSDRQPRCHPYILTVHQAGQTGFGHPYILMAYLPNGSLADRLERGVLPWRDVVSIGAKVADALQFAHDRNILHRDVKPENILVSASGEPVLADFGVASKVMATHTAEAMGTLLYAAPEVVAGRPASPSSDVYSLAATLFELLSGRPAFLDDEGLEVPAIIHRVLTATVPDLREGGVPAPVCAAIEAAMAKEPAERPISAADFRAALQATAPAGHTGRTTRLVRNHDEGGEERSADGRKPRAPLGVLAGIGATALLLVLGTFIALRSGRTPTTTTSTQPSTSTTAQGLSTTIGPATSSSGGPGTSSSVEPTRPPTLLGGTVLGRDVQPTAEDSCHTPGFANGSSWEVGAVQMNTATYSTAYNCNVFAGGVGSVNFELGRRYKTLTVTVGLADSSTSTAHLVTFTIIGDNVIYLAKPTTIQDGRTVNLSANVSQTSKLTLMIMDVTPAGGTSAPTTAVWGNPALTSS